MLSREHYREDGDEKGEDRGEEEVEEVEVVGVGEEEVEEGIDEEEVEEGDRSVDDQYCQVRIKYSPFINQ